MSLPELPAAIHAHGPTPAPRPPHRRQALTALASALIGAGALLASPMARAIGSQLDVTVIERDSGAASPSHHHRGQWYVAGRPGAKYAIRITNRSGERVLAVMSVDGVNIVTGQTASFEQSGYVLAPWQSAEITGWRKSPREVAAFVFTALPDSYAARTGRPHDVGVIGVAVFKERVVMRPPMPPISALEGERRSDAASPGGERDRARAEDAARATDGARASAGGAQAAQSAGAATAQAAPGAAPASPAAAAPPARERQAERLGTGHGERERSYAGRTHFERSSSSPLELISIRYDSHENLVLAGVIPPPVWASPTPQQPNAFPWSTRGYVPDPPRW